jgi:Glycosyl hydrolases family 18
MRRGSPARGRLILASVMAVMAALVLCATTACAGASRPGPSESPGSGANALPTAPLPPRGTACGRLMLAGASGAWLPDWLDDPGRPSVVPELARRLRLLDFFWLGLGQSPESILQRPDNPAASPLDNVLSAAATANPCALRFVTVADQRTPKATMARILLDPATRSRNAAALAAMMGTYPQADGLTLDYEYALPASRGELDLYASVAGWHGLTAQQEIARVADGYTRLVRELALAMHRQHRALRVAVKPRAAGGSDLSDPAPLVYDYGALAKYADQIVLMAIDFHWAGSDPGPIAPLAEVENALAGVRAYQVPDARLAVELAVYGYDWTVDAAGRRIPGTQAASVTATGIAAEHWTTTGSSDGETSYEYTSRGHRHVVWFAGRALASRAVSLRRLYSGIAGIAWAAGNTDPAGVALISRALGG